MTINPHEAVTKMTSEEYHDFMHGARQQQQAEEDHFTAVHAEREQGDMEGIIGAKMTTRSSPSEIAEALIAAGYRKAEETLKEIDEPHQSDPVVLRHDGQEEPPPGPYYPPESAEYDYYENGASTDRFIPLGEDTYGVPAVKRNARTNLYEDRQEQS